MQLIPKAFHITENRTMFSTIYSYEQVVSTLFLDPLNHMYLF